MKIKIGERLTEDIFAKAELTTMANNGELVSRPAPVLCMKEKTGDNPHIFQTTAPRFLQV